LRLVKATVQDPIRIEREYDVVEFDNSILSFEDPLADRARINRVHLEFQAVTMPLNVSFK